MSEGYVGIPPSEYYLDSTSIRSRFYSSLGCRLRQLLQKKLSGFPLHGDYDVLYSSHLAEGGTDSIRHRVMVWLVYHRGPR